MEQPERPKLMLLQGGKLEETIYERELRLGTPNAEMYIGIEEAVDEYNARQGA